MASRKEEQERRRAERLAAEQREREGARRRLMAGYIVAGALGLAVVVGLVIVLTSGGSAGGTEGDSGSFPENAHIQALSGATDDLQPDDREGTPPPAIQEGDLEAAGEAAECELQLDLEDEGSTHFTDENKQVDYATDPPTSGDHYGVPTDTASGAMADGAWAETPAIPRAVHSLEHGRVEIQYSPDLSDAEQLELKGVFDDDPAGVLFFPNPDMPFDVAITAWTQMAGCKTYEGGPTLDVLRNFRDIYRGQGPEDVPVVTG